MGKKMKRVITYIACLVLTVAVLCILYSAYYRFYGAARAEQKYAEMLAECSEVEMVPLEIFQYPIDSTSTLIIAVDEISGGITIADIGAKNAIRGIDLLAYTGVCSYAIIGEDGKVVDMQLETARDGRSHIWMGTIEENRVLDMHLEAGTAAAGSIETEIIYIQYVADEDTPGDTIFSYPLGNSMLVVRAAN